MEPAADLGAALSIASSFMDKPVQTDIMVVGEIGLTGEVRPVNRMEERLKEGAKMGFNRCMLPKGNISQTLLSSVKEMEKELEMMQVSTLAQALNLAFAL